MKQTYINSSRRKDWIQIGFLALLLGSAPAAFAQEGTQGNTTVFNGGEAAFFGQHTFVAGGAGTQPGIIKTIRTAPFGIVSYAAGADHTGATDANHVDGYVGKYGTTAFTFPIGSATKLRPVSISAPTSGAFQAAYFAGSPNTATLPAGAPFPVANLGTGVLAVSNVEYWDVNGPSAINLTLTWDAASGLAALAGATMTNVVVIGYNTSTSKWENLGRAGGATGTLATTGSVTANGVTPDNYSAFTFGVASIGVPDLRVTIEMTREVLAVNTSADITVYIENSEPFATNGPVSVNIIKPSAASGLILTIDSSPDWVVTPTTLGFTITLASNTTIPANGFKIITGKMTRNGGPKGTFNFTPVITPNSGGETNNTNNNQSVIITKS